MGYVRSLRYGQAGRVTTSTAVGLRHGKPQQWAAPHSAATACGSSQGSSRPNTSRDTSTMAPAQGLQCEAGVQSVGVGANAKRLRWYLGLARHMPRRPAPGTHSNRAFAVMVAPVQSALRRQTQRGCGALSVIARSLSCLASEQRACNPIRRCCVDCTAAQLSKFVSTRTTVVLTCQLLLSCALAHATPDHACREDDLGDSDPDSDNSGEEEVEVPSRRAAKRGAPPVSRGCGPQQRARGWAGGT
jgi:hypothetical protein